MTSMPHGSRWAPARVLGSYGTRRRRTRSAAASASAHGEGLWCRFEGDGDELAGLRRWAPEYRREAWRRALADQGVADDALAEELGERFGTERRARHEVFADVPAALAAAGVPLALVTNGASCLQREKLAGSGLADRFDARRRVRRPRRRQARRVGVPARALARWERRRARR